MTSNRPAIEGRPPTSSHEPSPRRVADLIHRVTEMCAPVGHPVGIDTVDPPIDRVRPHANAVVAIIDRPDPGKGRTAAAALDRRVSAIIHRHPSDGMVRVSQHCDG